MHIGKRIREVLDEKGKGVTWLASKIPCERSNVYNIFRRDNIDTELLKTISVVLRHDFFAELSVMLHRELAEKAVPAEVGESLPTP